MSVPCVFKSFDPVGSKYEVQVKQTALELHKIFAANDFCDSWIG